MTKEQRMVLEFTKEFNLFYVEQLTIPTKKIANLRLALLREELQELKAAYEAVDIIQIADALGDLLYVTYGAALACGTEPSPQRKVYLMYRGTPTVIPQRQFHYRYHRLEETFAMLESTFTHGRSFEAALSTGYRDHTLSRIAALIELLVWSIYNTAEMFNLDLEPIFAEIHRSNMTKKGGTISPTGKLLKPPHYEPPNLVPIIMNMGR